VRKRGDKRLFPSLTRNSRGQFAASYSRDFNRFIRKIGVPQGVVFHSLRHDIADALRDADFLDEEIALVLGHIGDEGRRGKKVVTRRYGSKTEGTTPRRAKIINAAVYPDVRLPGPYQSPKGST
jgi:integrase